MQITYTGKLTAEQYNSLRKAVGWFEIHPDLAQKGLDNAAYMTVACEGDVPVGMARVITDYGYTVVIADVIVLPGYQGQGIGREMMTRVMAYICENIAPGQKKLINLMAAKGKEGFYQKFGFEERPNDRQGPGMTQWIEGLSS